jgi:hypothetical protein
MYSSSFGVGRFLRLSFNFFLKGEGSSYYLGFFSSISETESNTKKN